jgi:hypothetical protein
LRDGTFDRESFAGGLVQGSWHERGSTNQAGSVIATDYYGPSNNIYTVAASGIIFRGNYDGSGWTSLNDDLNFDNRVVQVLPNTSGNRRIVAAQGKQLKYSDNEGANWTNVVGLTFWDGWGHPEQLVEMSNHELYYLVRTWIDNPWGAGYHLYRSTNRGGNWTLMQSFPQRSYRSVALWQPFNTNELYVIDNGEKIYEANGANLSLLFNITDLPVDAEMSFSGSKAGTTKMYVLANGTDVYSSADEGETWDLQSSVNPGAWEVGICANPFVEDAIYYGEVNMHKSDDGGQTWSIQNEWWEYYDNVQLLHADIMSFTPGQNGSTNFILIGNHGGMHRTTDNFATTTNIGLSNLNVGQFYEHVTIGGNCYLGSQDQGGQVISSAGTGQVTAVQYLSGDYVEMASSNNNQRLWQEYPGGSFDYYHTPPTGGWTWPDKSYSVSGTAGANMQQWSVPMSPVGVASENAVLVGGGTTTNDDGSYLIKLTAGISPPHDITVSQFNYDFRVNANNGDSYITAVGQSSVNTSFYFVTMEDGTFFYSHNGGNSWNKATGFSAPSGGWLYGTSIVTSPTNANQLYVGGNGYGGNGVYRSVDGGVTFTAMSAGLPNTFINDLALNQNESLLFAATEAGPYVCILSTGGWHSLIGASTPLQPFQSVEYIASSSTARFTTYGRGVWDLALTSQPLPVEWLGFQAKAQPDKSVLLNWTVGNAKGSEYFDIQRSYDGISFEKIGQKTDKGSSAAYDYLDLIPRPGTNYYRLKQVDDNGFFSFSPTIAVEIDGTPALRLYPSIASAGTPLRVNTDEPAGYLVRLFGTNGQQVWSAQLEQQPVLPALSAGIYVYKIEHINRPGAVASGKLVVR